MSIRALCLRKTHFGKGRILKPRMYHANHIYTFPSEEFLPHDKNGEVNHFQVLGSASEEKKTKPEIMKDLQATLGWSNDDVGRFLGAKNIEHMDGAIRELEDVIKTNS